MKNYLCMLLLMPAFVLAQADKSDNPRATISDQSIQTDIYKWNVGLGVGTKDLGFLSSLVYDDGKSSYIFRYAYTSEFKIFGPIPEESVWDIGFLYGKTLRWGSKFMTYGIGISYVRLTERGSLLHPSSGLLEPDEYQRITTESIGVPLQIELSQPLFPFIGGSIIGFVNVNPVNLYAGAVLSIEIGKLK